MQCRVATPNDVPALVRLRWEFQTENGIPETGLDEEFAAVCTDFLARALAGDQWRIWVAEAAGEIVAHIYLQVIEKVPKPGYRRNRYAYMTNVYTVPRLQGQGIGGRLLREACRWAEAAGMEFIIVWPSERSRSFYAREGFRPVQDALELSFEDTDG